MAFSCQMIPQSDTSLDTQQYITVLGIAQDAGYPQINSSSEFRAVAYGDTKRQLVVSLGLVDKSSGKKWLFEATPDMPEQLHALSQNSMLSNKIVDGIFLTHAHMGHYTGLMYLGREAVNADRVPVFAMPRMKSFLENNQPWRQLLDLNNIAVKLVENEKPVVISKKLTVIPFIVPHRDEFSETVGYKIVGPKKSLLFIPDIDKWHLWNNDIIEEVKKVDYALLDATFYQDGEVARPMSEIPHPFIEETIDLFKDQPLEIKAKIYFIHFNHSNPTIHRDSSIRRIIEELGFKFADQDLVFPLD